MSEVVERMAREMFEENMTLCQTDLGFRHDEHWDTTPEANRQHWRKVARAGLSAMREPSTEMTDAAEVSVGEWRKTLSRDEAMARSYMPPPSRPRRFIASATPAEKHAIRWRAMIDEALK